MRRSNLSRVYFSRKNSARARVVFIECGFYRVVDRLVGRGGPAFFGKENQDLLGICSVTVTGWEHANADRQQAGKSNPGEYACCEGRTHTEKTFCPNFKQNRGSIALNVLVFNSYKGIGKRQLRRQQSSLRQDVWTKVQYTSWQHVSYLSENHEPHTQSYPIIYRGGCT